MTRSRRPWWRGLPVAFVAYVALALLLLRTLAHGVPRAAEPVISLVVLPVMYVFQPVYPLLDALGLLEGEWWRMPSTGGFVVGTAIHATVLWGLTHAGGRKR